MSKGAQLQISKTRSILRPNSYILALQNEFSPWAFDEERVIEFKNHWREHFGVAADAPLDLEIGTGNGLHFAHYAALHPERSLVGLELKYKPLIQSIRRCIRNGSTNARIARYNAVQLHDIFGRGELNRVMIHFPDPWERLRTQKHRLIQDHFLARLFEVQRPGNELEFKTDSRDYFDWALICFARSSYKMEFQTFDLHKSGVAQFATHFESLFMRQGLPIHYALLRRD